LILVVKGNMNQKMLRTTDLTFNGGLDTLSLERLY